MAVGIEFLIKWFQDQGVSAYITETMKCVKVFIFGIDILLFIFFIVNVVSKSLLRLNEKAN